MNVSESFSQDSVGLCLSTKWLSDNHKTVTYDHHFIDLKPNLDELLEKIRRKCHNHRLHPTVKRWKE